MFSTLLGPLPPDPDAAPRRVGCGSPSRWGHGPRRGRARARSATAIPRPTRNCRADSVVDRWSAAAASSGVPVKAVLVGPWTAARASGAAPGEAAERLRPTILALAAAGCPFVEIAETDVAAIGTDPAAAEAFADAHRRLVDGTEGVHCSLAATGGECRRRRSGDVLRPGVRELRLRPDRRTRQLAPDRRRAGRSRDRLRGDRAGDRRRSDPRGARVGGPLRGLDARPRAGPGRPGQRSGGARRPAPRRAEVLRRLALVAEASRIASVESAEEMAGLLDPRAVDARSAALGRFAPDRRRRRS